MHALTDRRFAVPLAAALVFAAVFAAYAISLNTTVAVGDEAEAQTVPYILGIAHPTGFPLYTLAGWVFSHALPVSTVAWRLNAFTAVCSALSAAGVFLLAITLAADAFAAAFAAFAFAFGSTVWGTAAHANAQSLAEVCGVYALLAAILFARSGRTRDLFVACACCGLGLATHPATVWVVPALAVALFWQRASVTRSAVCIGLLALALPLAFYAYLPLRSMLVAAHGLDPTAAPPLYGAGNFDWDTNATRTPTGFFDEILGRYHFAGRMVARTFDPRAIVEATEFWFSLAVRQYHVWILLLAGLGITALARVDRRSLSVLIAGTAGGMLFAYVYRFDTHLDRYVLLSFAVTAAVAAACQRLAVSKIPANIVRATVTLSLAALAGSAFARNSPPAFLIGYDGRTPIEVVKKATPDDAIIVAQWNDAAALGYAAFVDHALGKRVIVAAWPEEFADKYPLWIKTRPVRLLISPLGWTRLPDLPLRERLDYSKQGGYAVIALGGPKASTRRTR